MFNLDPSKLLIIGVIAVMVLGPDKLPQAARQLGMTMRSFNEFRHRLESEVRSSIPDLPSTSDLARMARSPVALLDHLGSMESSATPDTPTDLREAAAKTEAPDDIAIGPAGLKLSGAGPRRVDDLTSGGAIVTSDARLN